MNVSLHVTVVTVKRRIKLSKRKDFLGNIQ